MSLAKIILEKLHEGIDKRLLIIKRKIAKKDFNVFIDDFKWLSPSGRDSPFPENSYEVDEIANIADVVVFNVNSKEILSKEERISAIEDLLEYGIEYPFVLFTNGLSPAIIFNFNGIEITSFNPNYDQMLLDLIVTEDEFNNEIFTENELALQKMNKIFLGKVNTQ
jgi:hypothetical protein